MSTDYKLHFAPDNASLIVRIALEMIGAPYEAVLVDRSAAAQNSPAYRVLNPLGMIPALETQDGTLFETGAILLWLSDRHHALLPNANDPARGDALKWLFFLSNSLHAGLRQFFYPEKFIAPQFSAELRKGLAQRLMADFAQLEARAYDPDTTVLNGPNVSALDIYTCTCLRWAQLYPLDYTKTWLDLNALPTLMSLARRLELEPAVKHVQTAEGLGLTPFSQPVLATPPFGSAT